MSKKRVIKSYEKLSDELLALLEATYPNGYSDRLIYYTDKEGKLIPAIPLETEDALYMVKLPVQTIVVEDEPGEDGAATKSRDDDEDGLSDHRPVRSEEDGISYISIGGTNEDYESIERGEDPDY